jgi:RNA polymerase sigma-70 factor (ECF subfamily)
MSPFRFASPPTDSIVKTSDSPDAPSKTVSQVVEHLFRHEAGKMVASLTGKFGIEHLTLAEDVVQEALARALQTWPFHGVPDNPAAWIMRTSRNLALDVVRREKVFRGKEEAIIHSMEREPVGPAATGAADQEIADDTLRMMFVCCHPQIPPEAQVALALKTLCGFSPAEIAKAFLSSEAAIAKRLTRAKQRISEAGIRFEIPEGEELTRRLDGVRQALYLMFNEGYKASSGEKLIREDVCQEAIRLTSLLAAHPRGNQPETHALLALMFLSAARFAARVDGEGQLLRLQVQDRSRWDQGKIARGMFHLAQSASGDAMGEYHLQAAISACHCTARDYASTDWSRILGLYDLLIEIDDSPVVALNRAVALAEANGPQAGIDAVNGISSLKSLESYYLLHAALGEFEARLNHPQLAAAHFRKALQLAEIRSEREFLAKRLQECGDAEAG